MRASRQAISLAAFGRTARPLVVAREVSRSGLRKFSLGPQAQAMSVSKISELETKIGALCVKGETEEASLQATWPPSLGAAATRSLLEGAVWEFQPNRASQQDPAPAIVHVMFPPGCVDDAGAVTGAVNFPGGGQPTRADANGGTDCATC